VCTQRQERYSSSGFGVFLGVFFEERIFTEKCSNMNCKDFAIFTALLILGILRLLRKVASWDRTWKK